MAETVTCDFASAEATPPPAQWRDLLLGVRIKLRVETGLVSAAIEAQVSRDLYAFHQGQDVLGRYGFAAEEAGLLADANIAAGFSMMLHTCIRGVALIEEWNLVDPDGQKIDVAPETVRGLFQHGVGPGTGGLLMSSFQRLCDAPRRARLDEGNGFAPSRNGAIAAWHHRGGATHCAGCRDEGLACASGGRSEGALCPEVEHAPQTPEGVAALKACARPGVWRRAGMSGVVTGLDLGEAMLTARLFGAADAAFLAELLRELEVGALSGVAMTAKKE